MNKITAYILKVIYTHLSTRPSYKTARNILSVITAGIITTLIIISYEVLKGAVGLVIEYPVTLLMFLFILFLLTAKGK